MQAGLPSPAPGPPHSLEMRWAWQPSLRAVGCGLDARALGDDAGDGRLRSRRGIDDAGHTQPVDRSESDRVGHGKRVAGVVFDRSGELFVLPGELFVLPVDVGVRLFEQRTYAGQQSLPPWQESFPPLHAGNFPCCKRRTLRSKGSRLCCPERGLSCNIHRPARKVFLRRTREVSFPATSNRKLRQSMVRAGKDDRFRGVPIRRCAMCMGGQRAQGAFLASGWISRGGT